MRTDDVHVFISCFRREDEALAYSQAQWEPEPGEDASDEDYKAWEDSNPSWLMRKELGEPYLDSDFIEIVWGTGDGEPGVRWDYLASVIGSANTSVCQRLAPSEATTLILIFGQALGGFPFAFSSTPEMTYCGAFPWLS